MNNIIEQAKQLCEELKLVKHNDMFYAISMPAIVYDMNGKAVISVSMQPSPNDSLQPSVDSLNAFRAFLNKEFIAISGLRNYTLHTTTFLEIVLPTGEVLRKFQLTASRLTQDD